MTAESTFEKLSAAAAAVRSSTGWDLSFLGVRELGEVLPWDFETEAREALVSAQAAIDLGTGGAEVLLRIARQPRDNLIATEQWAPNARLAEKRLRPLGIPVVWCEAEGTRMPFRDGAFDLVLDRHEALTPAEVDRVLAPGGIVLTQQVTSHTMPELRRYIPRATAFPNHDDEYPATFELLGYEVHVRRHEFEVAFPSLASVVQFLVLAPWTVPDFSVERDFESLLTIERELTTVEGIVFRDGRYILRAKKRH